MGGDEKKYVSTTTNFKIFKCHISLTDEFSVQFNYFY